MVNLSQHRSVASHTNKPHTHTKLIVFVRPLLCYRVLRTSAKSTGPSKGAAFELIVTYNRNSKMDSIASKLFDGCTAFKVTVAWTGQILSLLTFSILSWSACAANFHRISWCSLSLTLSWVVKQFLHTPQHNKTPSPIIQPHNAHFGSFILS